MRTPLAPRGRPIGRSIDWLHTRVLIPAYETGLKRRRTFAIWRGLEKSQWLSGEEIGRLQFQALRRLLTHAAETCAYFRDRWAELALDPASIQSVRDLERWPVISKHDLRANRQTIRSSLGLDMLSKTTSGSTGEPFTIEYDTGSLDRRMAAAFRGYSWAEAPPGAKQFYYWGVPVLSRAWRARWKDEWHHRLYRRVLENCLEFRDHAAIDVLVRYERARPAALVAYTRPLYELSRLLSERGLRPTPPRAIVVGAEELHDFQRALIESVWGAPVFETYGCREVMLIGAECDRHSGLHLTSEHLVVEIVDEDGRAVSDGQEGRVVVTDLYNYGAPFIRYDLGDRAVKSGRRCPCGRGLPMLERVVGRRLDVVVTPDGRLVPGEAFPYIFKDVPEVGRYQVVQVAGDRLEVRIEPRSDWSPEVAASLMDRLRVVLGTEIGVHLQTVDRLDSGTSDKLLVVRNPWLAQQREAVRPTRAS